MYSDFALLKSRLPHEGKHQVKKILALLRPYQYTKNLFILAPAFFAFSLHERETLIHSLTAFLIFCCFASAVYAINDCLDKDKDRLHPTKQKRPVASGELTIKAALGIATVLILIGTGMALALRPAILYPILIYMGINLAYSLKLKQFPLIELFLIASGFVLRLFVGAAATGIELTQWIILITFLLALFLALAKRRGDVIILLKHKQMMRESVEGYNLKFLDTAIAVCAAVVIMSYILWTMSADVQSKLMSDKLFYTAVFVIMGIFRYLQIAFVYEKSDDPARVLLRDMPLQVIVVSWALSFVLFLNFGK